GSEQPRRKCPWNFSARPLGSAGRMSQQPEPKPSVEPEGADLPARDAEREPSAEVAPASVGAESTPSEGPVEGPAAAPALPSEPPPSGGTRTENLARRA